MTGVALHQRVAAVRMMFSMWLTENVQVRRPVFIRRYREN